MSSKKATSEPNKLITVSHCFQRAIVRAYGEEPLLRNVCLREDGIVMVKNDRIANEPRQETENDNWVGWPRDDVYRYNASAYELLSGFYKEGEIEKLKEAWPTLEKLFP